MAGNQKPRIHVMPDYSTTYGDVVVDMMHGYGLDLDEWQADLMRDWFALDEDGKYAASPCGLSVPRQNGKSANVRARCVGGMLLFSECILFTAHEVKTARKSFEEMAEMFDQNGRFPDLAAQVDFIRRANGQEEIKLIDYQDENGEWHEGGRVIFSARSRGAARGFTCDVLICDEAQELTSEQMAALMPTISAGKRKNSQVIMLGTPPDIGNFGEVFENTRKAALSETPMRTSWSEWSVPEICDSRDWSKVEDTNPALDVRLDRKAVEAEMNAMTEEFFCRERLGWWSSKSVKAVVDADAWDACATDAPPDGTVTYAVKCTPDNAVMTLSVCCKPDEGKPHVEVVMTQPTSDGISGIVEWLASRASDAAAIVIDGQGTAQAITDRLLEQRVGKNTIVRPRSNDMASACSTLLNAVNEGAVTHYAQEELDAAAKSCCKRSIGSGGGWGFAGDGAALVEAVALAHWGALNTKRNPKRKMRMG